MRHVHGAVTFFNREISFIHLWICCKYRYELYLQEVFNAIGGATYMGGLRAII